MRFHLIDKLVKYEKWKEGIAIKNVTRGTPEFIHNHYMEDSLLLECIFQCAAWLIVVSSDQKFRPTIVTAEKYNIYKHIGIGSQLKIHVYITDYDDDCAVIRGEIYSGDTLCVTLENAILKLVDTKILEDPELTKKYLTYLTS